MIERLYVMLEAELIGVLDRARGDRLTFTYDAAYRSRGDTTPLSVSMPVAVPRHADRVVRPWLWGLLPEDDGVRRRWADRFQVPASPFALLGTPIGMDCPGAVRFSVEPDEAQRPGRRQVEWLTDAEVAERLRALRRDSTAWLGGDFAGRFSLAGAQAKTALLFEGGRWGIPRANVPTTHILKPAIAGLDEHDLNEHVCLRAAAAAGLVVARTELRRFDDETAIVVERFDRVRRGSTWRRVHQEDLCQALSVHPEGKYQADGGPGPGDVAALFRRVMPSSIATDASSRFADALVWNWIIGGTDAHAKNYALLLAGPDVRLAPLYDVASSLLYGHERKLRLAMKFGPEYRLHAARPSTIRRLAEDLQLEPDALRDRVVGLLAAAPDAFRDTAREVRTLRSGLPARLADAVADRTHRLAAGLGVMP